MARHPALDRQMDRRSKPVAHKLAEISRRVMRMHIADHRAFPLLCRRVKVKPRRGARASGCREGAGDEKRTGQAYHCICAQPSSVLTIGRSPATNENPADRDLV